MRSRLPLEALLARPNLGVGVALGLLTVLAWLHFLGAGPAAGHAAHAAMTHATARASQAAEVGEAFVTWLVMAVAMMLPTAAPAILSFADIVRRPGGGSAGVGRLAAFVGGYLAAWWGFAVLATAMQWGLALTAPAIAGGRTGEAVFAGVLLVAAGFYQFSALKHRCLSECRSPIAFFLARWREGTRGALCLGLRHGIHCVGCCWALMALMLLAGAMNVGWMAVLTALMLAEKVLPGGPVLGRAVGVGLIVWGSALLASA